MISLEDAIEQCSLPTSQKACKNRASEEVDCESRKMSECYEDLKCMFRAAGKPKCAPAKPENCPGMAEKVCKKFPADLCYWNLGQASGKKNLACFPRPKPEGLEEQGYDYSKSIQKTLMEAKQRSEDKKQAAKQVEVRLHEITSTTT